MFILVNIHPNAGGGSMIVPVSDIRGVEQGGDNNTVISLGSVGTERREPVSTTHTVDSIFDSLKVMTHGQAHRVK